MLSKVCRYPLLHAGTGISTTDDDRQADGVKTIPKGVLRLRPVVGQTRGAMIRERTAALAAAVMRCYHLHHACPGDAQALKQMMRPAF